MDITRVRFFIELGEKLADKIRTRTQKGKDVYGTTFVEYSASYEKYKANKNKKKKRRQSSFKVSKPDLTFTGDMLLDLQVRDASDKHVSIGWQGTYAERLEYNEDNGRFVSTKNQPVSKAEEKFIDKEIGREIERNLKVEAKKGKKKLLRLNIF